MARQARIYNLDVKYTTAYRDVKYPRLEFKTGGLLLVLPKGYGRHATLVEKHKDWIYAKRVQIQKALDESKRCKLVLSRTDREFRVQTLSIADHLAGELGVTLNGVCFRGMRSKWGSCSSEGKLTLNTLLKFLPKRLILYVVFHELAHKIERKHNGRFWSVVSSKFRDYKELEAHLFEYWLLIHKSGIAKA